MSDLPPSRPSINSWSPEFLDSMYLAWQTNPESVDPQWQYFFQGFDLAQSGSETSHKISPSTDDFYRNARVQSLVYHYRDIGHMKADLDPLGTARPTPEHLTLSSFDLKPEDLDQPFTTTVCGLRKPSLLRDIISLLEDTYCSTVGFEYMHITSTEERRWFQERVESTRAIPDLSPEEKKYILLKLHQAETFEGFLQKAYQGEKRFSLEGGETLIPLVACALDRAAQLGVTEGVLGMAHRGRLNILANIMHKGYDDIFAEFEGNYTNTYMGGGDVKYHKGYSGDFKTLSGKPVYMTLVANPSHLEAVDPVVLGRARAKQLSKGPGNRTEVLPILIHGDAAFAGQGIIAELLNMSSLPGYAVGGTLHLIINNQIGFTTSPRSARSTPYCTDVARMIEAPIIHVNGEDPERCIMAVKLAVEYRQKFGKDIVVDMWCYRKYGHNESDEPAFTQPRMYETIRAKQPVRHIYAARLLKDGVINEAEAVNMREALELILNDAHQRGRIEPADPNLPGFQKKWEGLSKDFNFDLVNTAVAEPVLRDMADRMEKVPDGFTVHTRLKTILARRWKSVRDGKGLDWGTGELLAFATLVAQGIPVRLSGQDSRRGTFSHRHAVLVDQHTEADYTPLNNIDPKQAPFLVYDSPLSEVSVLGFEYGYSIAEPNMLVMWEAQFGDFANGAQVIIDQFLASAEAKWDRASGLALLLPHGYEGQGPEHSSARLERFLQLCAEDNIQVVNVTTPAQYFHLLRRQVLRRFRKPLVVMSPKSLLRRPEAVSDLAQFAEGHFEEILDDPEVTNRGAVKRILLCSGKVFYDLVARRRAIDDYSTAIVRLEQIYPLHAQRLQEVLATYPNANDVAWVQEEPKNMGAWSHLNEALQDKLGLHVAYYGRRAAATPAVGSAKLHEKEQNALLEAALPARPQVKVS